MVEEIQTCGAANVRALQSAADHLTTGSTPSEDVSAELDHLIEQVHTAMASSSPQSSFSWRRMYTESCILRALVDVRAFYITSDTSFALASISKLDQAIVIAGAPGEGRLDLITDLINEVQSRCLARAISRNGLVAFPTQINIATIHPLSAASQSVIQLGVPPSLASFLSRYSKQPFVIPKYIKDWPAMNEHPWASPDYLRAVAGPGRVVPVEVGSDYRDNDWTQKLMPWDEFLDALVEGPQSKIDRSCRPVLYLAQHDLLMQFPGLRADIEVPDYAYASLPPPPDFPDYTPPGNEDQLVLNAWLGPMGTVSPAHTDPYFNFYAQVVGRKIVWLAPPSVSSSMYAYPPPSSSSVSATPDPPHNPAANTANPSMSNTSQVDVFRPRTDHEHVPDAWPSFWQNVVPHAMSVTLEPGDLLFFPPGWWHAMRSEETSFSVSMWF